MKKILAVCLGVFVAGLVSAQQLSGPPGGDNQKSRITQFIGPVEVTITYSSPDVHLPNGDDRTGKIWGTPVAHYGFVAQGFGAGNPAPWRAGANENTVITFSDDVKIEGKELKAGTYGLFLAVQKEGPWTWVFSKNSTSWGSFFYNATEDALRLDFPAKDGAYTEYLTYGFDDRKASSATAFLQWENKKISFNISVSGVNDLYLAKMRNELRSTTGFDYRNYSNAAMFCANNKVSLEEGLAWADKAMDPNIGGVADFNTMSAKALVLTAMGRGPESSEIMDKAIKMPGVLVQQIHQYGRTLLNGGYKEKAMEVFQFNAKTHPEDKFTPNVGLARGYTAMGDKKKAIQYWEIAVKNIPENQKANSAFYEGELKKLKESGV